MSIGFLISRNDRSSGGLSALVILSIIACGAQIGWADPPPGYYDPVDTTDSTTLRTTLHEVIDDHLRFPYFHNTNTDTWDILDLADQDPTNSSNILDVYKNATYPKAEGENSFYNREHTWPSSYGFPNNVVANYPYTDCHHLRLSNDSYNSSRGRRLYRDCHSGCTEKTTEMNNNQGGGMGEYPGNSNWGEGPQNDETGTWETWIGKRGDVAR
ncbi:MAG: endonuclease, partial [Planctomycetota bacterium]|nr:endonuclease [Planctomycetota bacterium]